MTALHLTGEGRGGESERSAQTTCVRCACDRCGTHVMALRSWHLTGSCENCGSCALTPLDPVCADALVAAAAPIVHTEFSAPAGAPLLWAAGLLLGLSTPGTA